MPLYGQIKVIGFLRWLFGYLPVTGPVSMAGAVLQLTAFVAIGIVAMISWIRLDIFSNMYVAALIVGGVWIVSIRVALGFVMWLWNRQQGDNKE